jgi:hypothetical protein
MGIAANVRVTEGNVDCILSDGRGIHGKVGFLVSPLIDAKAEVMPPQFLAGVSMKA